MSGTAPRPLVLSLVALLLVACGALTYAGTADAAKPVQRGSLKVTNASVPAGGSIVLYGKIKKKSQRAVKLQVEGPEGRWETVTQTRTNRRGRFSVAVVTPMTPGRVVYRALVPKYALISSRQETGGKKFASTITTSVTVTLTSAPGPGPSTSPAPTPSPSASTSPSPLLPCLGTICLPGLPGLPLD